MCVCVFQFDSACFDTNMYVIVLYLQSYVFTEKHYYNSKPLEINVVYIPTNTVSHSTSDVFK